ARPPPFPYTTLFRSCGPTPWAMTRLHCGVRTQILATWLNPSSTGVSRPKMDTRTLSFWASTLISEIEAGSVSNGPSVTVTDSPRSEEHTSELQSREN